MSQFVRVLSRCQTVYIHTASRTSFWRKSLFILIAHAAGKGVILHVHPTSFFRTYLPALSSLAATLARSVLRRVRSVVVLTGAQGRDAQAQMPGVPVHIVPNAVDIGIYDSQRPPARQTDLLVYLGWYIREKGVFDLVDSVRLLVAEGRRLTVRMHGAHGAEALREYVASCGLEEIIKVGDWIDDAHKSELLRAATGFIFPSHSEGVPNAVLEAMAAGTPVVSTDVGGLAEVLRHRENALVFRPASPVDMAGKIAELLDDPALREKLARMATTDVARQFSLEVVRDRLDGLLGQPRGA